MERIKQALELARADRRRAGKNAAASGARQRRRTHGHQEIVYTQTRSLEVAPDFLRRRHVISGRTDPVADAYKVLRTQVLQIMRDNDLRSLAVTSPTEGAGKTLTAVNLAISFAREMNQTVLLVDLDLRQPRVADHFSDEPMRGLSDYLLQDCPLNELLFHPGIERLVVLPGNQPVDHSSEALSSPKMVDLVTELRDRYESRILVFDMPPVLGGDDVLAFSPYFDSALLVAEAGRTKKSDLRRTVELLEKCALLGTVLNKGGRPGAHYV